MQSPGTPRVARTRAKKKKFISDPLHGHMEFSHELVSIIDTLYFQRLRELRQLGSADWVFPGAIHNRFIHSLGVAYLANFVIERLRHKYPEHISERDCVLVGLAGLCHDMGHGPYSHGFETVVQCVLEEERSKAPTKEARQRIPRQWHHEQASEMLFEEAVVESGLQIEEDEREFVKAMIRGVGANEHRPMNKPLFFFQIVANKQTGMDVDKYDYLLRDSLFCGAKVAFDMARLLRPELRTDRDGNIILAYYRKEEWMIHQLFRARFDMHHQVYGHAVVVALGLMLQEVLLLAKHWLRISEAITVPKLYLHLTDSVIPRIETLDVNSPPSGFTTSSLVKTQNLIQRIKQRDLYTSVLQDAHMNMNLGVETTGVRKVDKVRMERELINRLIKIEPELEQYQGEFIVVVADRDFTRREENPLLHVPFYSTRGGTTEDIVHYLTKEDLDNTTQPAKFWERFVRVFVKQIRAEYANTLVCLAAPFDTHVRTYTCTPRTHRSI